MFKTIPRIAPFFLTAIALVACGGGDSEPDSGSYGNSAASGNASGLGYVATAGAQAAASSATSSNATSGKVANGTPALALGNCTSMDSIQYWKCTANAIVNFNVSLVDATRGVTCTANYSNGVLTVSQGGVVITSLINGNMLSTIETVGSGAAATVVQLGGFRSAGMVVDTGYVNWNAAGALIRIEGMHTVLTGGGQEISCARPG